MLDAETRVRTLVVGSGVSGSLLVRALAEAGAPGPVILVDERAHPCRGRRWAGWEASSPATAGTRRFRRLGVHGAAGERVLELTDHRYTTWDGAALDAGTDAALRRLGGRRLVASVASISGIGRSVGIDTDSGRFEADLVLDSVGIDAAAQSPAQAWLHFTGWQVRSDAPTFAPNTVTLMDFRVPQRGELRFVYVLPTSSRTALVELTAFAGRPEPRDLVADLAAYLDGATGGGGWTVLGRESGTLALSLRQRRRRRGSHVLIGSAAGMVKASTGYGYHRMERDAALLAADIAAGRAPRGLRRRRRHDWMDAVFLELVRSDPAVLARALEQLFDRNPTDRVVRFLDEESTLVDEARIVVTLPVGPFVRAALRVLMRRH